MALHDIVQPHIGTLEVDGQRLDVSCRIAFDGVEYVGRLWFADPQLNDSGMADRGALPGRSRDEVIALAERLTSAELALRYRRAVAERRRYLELRRTTEDVLSKIRYLNQVSISMRAGLLDEEGAAQELDTTEKQLHELVERLRFAAGVEGDREIHSFRHGFPSAAHVLSQIAAYLELAGENPFKARAYERAARSLLALGADDLVPLLRSGELASVRGLGPATLAVVRDLAETGESATSSSCARRCPTGCSSSCACRV